MQANNNRLKAMHLTKKKTRSSAKVLECMNCGHLEDYNSKWATIVTVVVAPNTKMQDNHYKTFIFHTLYLLLLSGVAISLLCYGHWLLLNFYQVTLQYKIPHNFNMGADSNSMKRHVKLRLRHISDTKIQS